MSEQTTEPRTAEQQASSCKILRFPTPKEGPVESPMDLSTLPPPQLLGGSAGLAAAAALGAPGASPASARRRTLLAAPGSASAASLVETPAEQTAAAPGASPWQRFAFVRRRRGETKNAQTSGTAGASTTASDPAAADSADAGCPTVTQLMTWMLNLRRGGVGFIYWNAAKLPLEAALMRAARLDEAAVIDVVGHRVLVVEPLRPRAIAPESGAAEPAHTVAPALAPAT